MVDENIVQNVLKNALEKIIEELVKLYKAFKESREHVVGKKIIYINRIDTKYCYVVDLSLIAYPEIKVGLRVVCELDFEIYDNNMIDLSDINTRKEELISKLRERLSV
jgi:hypothetical protein